MLRTSAALAGWLGGGPLADPTILIASEFATNSILRGVDGDAGGHIAWARLGAHAFLVSQVTAR